MAKGVSEKRKLEIEKAIEFLAENGVMVKKTGRKTKKDIEREITVAKATLKNHEYRCIGKDQAQCTDCEKIKSTKEHNWYKSNSRMNNATGIIPVCKACLNEYFNQYMIQTAGDYRRSIYLICQEVNSYFSQQIVDTVINGKTDNTLGWYFKNVNSLKQYDGKTFIDSDPYDMTAEELKIERDIEAGKLKLSEAELQAKAEIIQAIGHDPYADMELLDQKSLYPELVEYLDEDTQENTFLVGQIVQITINNNTIKKINATLSKLTTDVSQLNKNKSDITSLVNTIEKLSSATTRIAKENGVAKKGGESKRRSTLTGMMTYYRDLDLDAIEVDFYDQVTSIGMERVAKISHKAIFDQGLFNDNDFEVMLRHSRDLVESLNRKVLDLEEDNRVLRKQLYEAGIEYA